MSDERPNVLWIITDQHRPGWLGGTDHPVRTPNVDALADRGIRFENAVCPSPLCAPCRASLATGLAYDRAPVAGNGADLPLSATTLYERLRDEAGYHVMGCGKFDLHKASYDWGINGQHRLEEWGFSAGIDNAGKYDAVLALITATNPAKLEDDLDWVSEWRAALASGQLEPMDPYADYLKSEGHLDTHVEDYARRVETDGPATFPTQLPDEAYCDNWIGRQGLDLLTDAPSEQPWFLQVNFAGPHQPWDVTEEMHNWYRDPEVTFSGPVNPDADIDSETHQGVRRNYAAMIENIDRWVGRFRDRLQERGELDDTMIVFAADHGEMLGDHRRWRKAVPYRGSSGVPLVIAGPAVRARPPVETPVNLLDLHATALEDAGLSREGLDSRSLRGVLSGGDPPREITTSALEDWQLATDGRFSLVSGFDFGDDLAGEWSDPVLFDRESDSGETRSVAESHPGVVEELSTALDR